MSTQPNTPKNLIVHCDARLAEVRKFADETNQRDQFEEKLADVALFSNHEIFVHLYTDFAPMSFYWVATTGEDGPRYMNGGLIYHGQIPNHGDQPQTFSVCLTPTSGWSIHT